MSPHDEPLRLDSEDLFSPRIVGAEPRCELSSILQVEQHPRHESGYLFGSREGCQPGGAGAVKMIKSRNPAFVEEVCHEGVSTAREWGCPAPRRQSMFFRGTQEL